MRVIISDINEKNMPEKVKEIKKIAHDHLKSFEPPKSLLDSRTSDSF